MHAPLLLLGPLSLSLSHPVKMTATETILDVEAYLDEKLAFFREEGVSL
eukprot:COSAG06_NODE_37_length_30537_cov_73.315658_8_plen_49_part_00